ncbi:hypothetical protein C8Q78DRAFT_1008323 [Trametes maxima]|nr:hypothetical protein C8Q78DRAFT_1008323 [Trametes maxima]
MSDSASEIALLIAYYDSIFVENCCGFASISYLLYEYFVTFDLEVAYFWGRKVTGATVLFFCNRYLPLIVNVVSLVGLAPLTARGCDVMVHLSPMLDILQYIPWAIFAGLRVFALGGRHWLLPLVVLLLSLVPVGINLYFYTTLRSINDPIFGCEASRDIPPALARRNTIASRSCLMAADLLVILMTWHAMHGSRKLNREVLGRPSFAETLLRDGTIYFVWVLASLVREDYRLTSLRTLLILNALHLTFTLLPLINGSLSPVSYVTLFTEPITAVLVSRFLLNLQAVNQRAVDVNSTMLHGGTIDFERVVGSLGGSLFVLSEPPHVPTDDTSETAQDHEPRQNKTSECTFESDIELAGRRPGTD